MMGKEIEMKDFLKHMQKPKIFAKSTAPFWDDAYISEQLLKAHLDPQSDLASRKHEEIDKSVEWIIEELALQKGSEILDLGCGPGLYSTRFAESGHKTTGIDYSKRSIQYAKEYATSKKLDIEYIYKDYLTIDYSNAFDLATLIYYDLGVLADHERDLLLGKIHKLLKPGGYFVFDVFTPQYHDSIDEESTWEFEKKGFWKAEPYLLLTEKFKYPEHNVLLTQYLVIDENANIDIYRIWDHAYTKNSLSQILSNGGFHAMQFYSDIIGSEYSDNSKTMAIIAQKAA